LPFGVITESNQSLDLAANDDFQLELFRFSEVRDTFMSDEIANGRTQQGVKECEHGYGNSIKRLTQLIATYYLVRSETGSGDGEKSQELFAGDVYDIFVKPPRTCVSDQCISWTCSNVSETLAVEKLSSAS